MAATFITVTNSENQTLQSRFTSQRQGKNSNTVHVHAALTSSMVFAGAPGAFVSAIAPAIPIQIRGETLKLKNVNVVKSNLIQFTHAGSAQTAFFNYPNALFYNFETLMVGVSASVYQPTTVVSNFVSQNQFTVPLLNQATLKESGLNYHLNEEYRLMNNNSFFNIWLRNESGSGANDIENLLGILLAGLGLLGVSVTSIQLKYGIFATFEID